MHPDQIVIAPIITEKALDGRLLSRYVFKVHKDATKLDVARSIEQMFKVKVLAVNTVKVRPKKRVLGRSIGQISGWKKAYVTLKQGQKIEELES